MTLFTGFVEFDELGDFKDDDSGIGGDIIFERSGDGGDDDDRKGG